MPQFGHDISQKKIDDIYALVFARPISKKISKILSKTGITPNQVSGIGIVLGLVSATLLVFGNNILAAVVLYLSFLADCIDGEIARLKQQFTKLGLWLESSLDSIPLLLAIFAIGFISQLWLLTALAASVLLLTRIRMLASDFLSMKFGLKISDGIIANPVKKLLWQLRYGNSLQYMILIISLLFGRYSLSLWLTIILAGGYYVIVIIYEIKYYSKIK